MMESESRRFPQRRNGVKHPTYGVGTVTLGPGASPEGMVQVKFESLPGPLFVSVTNLTSNPATSISPDPATSRNSGWVYGNSYRKMK